MARFKATKKINKTFGRTAVKTKRINLAPKIMRGGGTIIMATKFKTAYGEHLHPAQSFDHKKISFKRAGVDYNIYDLIQASREDTEIYPTLEKYGMLPNIETAAEFFKNKAAGFFADFKEIMNKRDFHELQTKAENKWKALPREIREEFHNDKEEFMSTGLEWWDKKLKEATKEIEQTTTEPTNEQK